MMKEGPKNKGGGEITGFLKNPVLFRPSPTPASTRTFANRARASSASRLGGRQHADALGEHRGGLIEAPCLELRPEIG
jgi:hypothetical protein